MQACEVGEEEDQRVVKETSLNGDLRRRKEIETLKNRKNKKEVSIRGDSIYHSKEPKGPKKLHDSPQKIVYKELCIVINYTFKNDPLLTRKHYQKDIDIITKSMNQLGSFNIEILNDLSMTDLKSRLNDLISSIIEGHQKIMVVVTTHGLEGDLLIDDCKTSIHEFFRWFTVLFELETLKKVFLFSYCLGDNTAIYDDELYSDYPDFPNTFIAYSTLPGCECYSGKGGDVFIQCWFKYVERRWKAGKKIEVVNIQMKCQKWFKDMEFEFIGKNTAVQQQPWSTTTLKEVILYRPDAKKHFE